MRPWDPSVRVTMAVLVLSALTLLVMLLLALVRVALAVWAV